MQVPTRYDYLQNGLLSSTTNLGLNEQTLFEYDARGNRITVWANFPSASVTRYTYDLANRLLTEKNPLNTVTTFTYDAAGNRETKLDGNGQTTGYAYDDNRRLTTVTFSDATKYEYAYDSRGNRTLEKNANHERQLAYDARNQVETVTDVTFGKTLSYGYDANGNRASLTEGSTTFGYFYDSQNRLKRADAFGGGLFFEYDAAGRRTSLSRPNGIRTTYTYDDASQILGLVHSKGPAVVLGFSYEYDSRGMRLSKTRETGYREAYAYDSGDRLVRVDYGTSKRVEYGLDVLGNRVLEDSSTTPPTGLVRNSAVFNAFNQLTSAGGPGTTFPAATNAWDLNGNLLTETKTPSGLPPEVTTYGWDKDDRLRSVTPASGAVTSYSYDANGLRTQRVDATGASRYLLDQSSVVEELDASNTKLASYFSRPDAVDEILAFEKGGAVFSLLVDAIGSVVAIGDSAGVVVRTFSYTADGQRSTFGNGPTIDFGFTGREHDSGGVRYHRQRYAEPRSGRWIQPDPEGLFDSPNLYQYVAGIPTIATDPNGRVLFVGPARPIANLAAQIEIDTGILYMERGLEYGNLDIMAYGAAHFVTGLVISYMSGRRCKKSPQQMGKEFESGAANEFASKGYVVAEQLPVKTPFGKRVMDVVVWPKGYRGPGDLKDALWAFETKLGPRARYPTIQKLKDIWIETAHDIEIIVIKAIPK